MDHIKQRNAPSLTPELWAKVFSHTEELPEFSCWNNPIIQKKNQARVHQCKLVCKQFRNVFASHPGLVQRLFLWPDFSVTALPGLLAWLQKSKSSISMFQSACRSPLVEVVMAAFLSEPSLKLVDALDVSACTISIVGTFRSLEKCSLRHTQAEYLGLAPLGALQSLKYLILSGNFKEIHHLAGLTRLQFTNARVLGVQELAPTLQYLEIHYSTLLGMPAQGLSACTALTMLVLRNACLMGNHEDMYLDGALSVVPANIGLLTQLQTLHLSAATESTVPANLTWVSELTSLQSLIMCFDYSDGNVLQHASVLTKLTHLVIVKYLDIFVNTPVLNVDIQWHRLQALQDLSINRFRLRLGESISRLLQLPRLRQVSFAGSTAHGPDDTECLAALVYSFAKLRPNVELLFDNGNVADYF